MSVTWDMYVKYILAKGNVADVMIVDAEDCNHWAGTPDFMVITSSVLNSVTALILMTS
jgi:hypothetical protein